MIEMAMFSSEYLRWLTSEKFTKKEFSQAIADTDLTCHRCGWCCIAIRCPSLNKPADVRCKYLTEDNLCPFHGTSKQPESCRASAKIHFERFAEAVFEEEDPVAWIYFDNAFRKTIREKISCQIFADVLRTLFKIKKISINQF